MALNTMFIGWNRPVSGHEKQASGLFGGFVEYLTEKQSQGTIDSFEPVFLTTHGGDMNGFLLVRGDGEKLWKMKQDDAFMDLVTQCEIHVGGFGVIDAWSGEAVQEQFGRWQKFIG